MITDLLDRFEIFVKLKTVGTVFKKLKYIQNIQFNQIFSLLQRIVTLRLAYDTGYNHGYNLKVGEM